MSETPTLTLKKFHTISLTDKNYKSVLSTTANRLSQRKSNSVLANPQSIMNATLPIVDTNLSLPKIKETRRKQKKQGSFLQSWLDQALGAPDPFGTQKVQQQKVESNVLKTLKKFELDKRYLQSQNIPGQKIQKLYKSLYIYSHGVNKIFEDLIILTKEVQNPQLISNFWRAYTKLMQGCTSYQTVFQKIQKDHLISIQRLRSNIQSKAECYEQQKKQYDQRIYKLQKMLEQKQSKYNSLKSEFDVIQNTLDLTDQAFNEQVNLRLKFEQKINAIYTCYQELKSKYSKIVEEMKIKNCQILDQQNKQSQLKNKLLVQKTKVDELMFLLNAQKEKVKQRQLQIAIKVQELQDVKTIIAAKANQEDNTHDKMQEHLSKLKSVKTRLIQVENVVEGQRITIKQQNQQTAKLSKSLEQYKKYNNQTFQKYANAGKKIVELQSILNVKQMRISDLQKSGIQNSSQIGDLSRQLSHVKDQRDNLRHELNITCKNLKDTKQTMAKNNIMLEEMKAVKDKYQRINQYLRQQLKQLQTAHNKSMQDLSLKTQQLQGMKLLLDNRNKSLVQMQKNFEQQKQLNRVKIAALNATVTKKQNLTLQYQKKCDEYQRQVQNLKSSNKIAEDRCVILQSLKTKVEVELAGKIKLLGDLEKVLNKQSVKFAQLNNQLQTHLLQKANINSKLSTTQFVLKTKNEQQRLEVATLSALLNQYKVKIVEKAQYIHPMVYEQLLQVARRCQRNQANIKKQHQKQKKQLYLANTKAENLQLQLNQLKIKYNDLEKSNASTLSQKNKLTINIKNLQQTISVARNNLQKQQKTNKQLKKQIDESKKRQQTEKQKLKQLERQLSGMKARVKQLEELVESSRKKVSRAQTRQVKRKLTAEKQSQTENEQKQAEKQLMDQECQTQTVQMQKKQESLQKIINEQKEQEIMKPNLRQQKSQSYNISSSINNSNNISHSNNQSSKKQQVPQKKVQNKQFRKALKLTYMRR